MSKPKVNAPVGATLVVLSSFFYASYGIWTTLMGDFFGGYTASALRSVIVVLILIPIVSLARQWEPILWKKNWKYLVGLIISSLFIWGPLYYAILHAGMGLALTVNYASIVIGVFFFGWIMAGERLTKDKIIAACLGLSGLALVFLPGSTDIPTIALGAAVVSGLSSSFVMVIAKKIPYNSGQTMAALWVTSVIANVFMALVFRENNPSFGLYVEWVYLIIFAITSVIATWALIQGLKLIEAGAAGILGLLEIVFGVLFGIVFFQEKPTPLALLGVAIIIVASAIPYVKDFNIKSGTITDS